MRQYRILFRRSGSAPGTWATLRPHINAALYDKPAVNAAIEQMRTTPHIVGMAVQIEDEIFNIVSFNQDAEAAQAFKFTESKPPEDFVGTAADL
jgi:hypothetical protein